jgi:TetR/AcrR family transcriptional regulator
MTAESRSVDTRNKILEVAEKEFALEGYAGAHLQRIAEQVGVQKTALYYYFPSKAALYTAVLERMLEAFDRCVSEALDRPGTPEEQLERLLRLMNDLLAEHRNYSQVLIRVFVDRGQVVDPQRILGIIRNVIGRVLRFHREGTEAGAFRRMSARHFFQSVLGLTVFHYAARNFSAAVLGVDDIFTSNAVHWRRDEVRRLLRHGVLLRDEAESADATADDATAGDPDGDERGER